MLYLVIYITKECSSLLMKTTHELPKGSQIVPKYGTLDMGCHGNK